MSNLQDQQTVIFNKYGVFFAFSTKQFNEQKVEGVKYANMGAGMVAPAEHTSQVYDELNQLHLDYAANDVKINGKKKIILRELANHEAQINGCIDSTVDALELYDITREEVQAEFGSYMEYCIKHDLF